MIPPPHFDTSWGQWLTENIRRGCQPYALVDSMVHKGFDAERAQEVVAHYLSALPLGREPDLAQMRVLLQARRRDKAVPTGAKPRDTEAGAAASAAAMGQSSEVGGDYVYQTPRLPAGARIDVGDRVVQVVMRVERPVVAVLDAVLSPEECQALIAASRPKLTRSTVIDPVGGNAEVIADRTSQGCFFQLRETPLVARLDQRSARLMNMPVGHGEGLQILNYQPNHAYAPHFDYFPPQQPGSAKPMQEGGQRVATLILYLNDVEAGGETIFPELNLSVLPRQGSAVYFEYYNGLGQVDPLTLHGGAPVLRGEKWIATKWMRVKPRGP